MRIGSLAIIVAVFGRGATAWDHLAFASSKPTHLGHREGKFTGVSVLHSLPARSITTRRRSQVADTADGLGARDDVPGIWRALSGAYLGALLFGYHLGVVNAPLRSIAASLGFADSAAIQGTR